MPKLVYTKVVVWNPGPGAKQIIYDIPISEFTDTITAIIMGDYDNITNKQTFFAADRDGNLIKFTVKIVDNNGNLDLQKIGDPLILINNPSSTSSNTNIGQNRGATFINGNITLYAKKKVTYIKDQISNLNDIFKHLLNE